MEGSTLTCHFAEASKGHDVPKVTWSGWESSVRFYDRDHESDI